MSETTAKDLGCFFETENDVTKDLTNISETNAQYSSGEKMEKTLQQVNSETQILTKKEKTMLKLKKLIKKADKTFIIFELVERYVKLVNVKLKISKESIRFWKFFKKSKLSKKESKFGKKVQETIKKIDDHIEMTAMRILIVYLTDESAHVILPIYEHSDLPMKKCINSQTCTCKSILCYTVSRQKHQLRSFMTFFLDMHLQKTGKSQRHINISKILK